MSDIEPPHDLAEARVPVELSTMGLKQLMESYHAATVDIQHMLIYDCDVIMECKACRSLYRGLPNFIAHRRLYCLAEKADKSPEEEESLENCRRTLAGRKKSRKAKIVLTQKTSSSQHVVSVENVDKNKSHSSIEGCISKEEHVANTTSIETSEKMSVEEKTGGAGTRTASSCPSSLRSSSRRHVNLESGITSTFSLEDYLCPHCNYSSPMLNTVVKHVIAKHNYDKEKAVYYRIKLKEMNEKRRDQILKNLSTSRGTVIRTRQENQDVTQKGGFLCPVCPQTCSKIENVIDHLITGHGFDNEKANSYKGDIVSCADCQADDEIDTEHKRKQKFPGKCQSLEDNVMAKNISVGSSFSLWQCMNCDTVCGSESAMTAHLNFCTVAKIDSLDCVSNASSKAESVDVDVSAKSDITVLPSSLETKAAEDKTTAETVHEESVPAVKKPSADHNSNLQVVNVMEDNSTCTTFTLNESLAASDEIAQAIDTSNDTEQSETCISIEEKTPEKEKGNDEFEQTKSKEQSPLLEDAMDDDEDVDITFPANDKRCISDQNITCHEVMCEAEADTSKSKEQNQALDTVLDDDEVDTPFRANDIGCTTNENVICHEVTCVAQEDSSKDRKRKFDESHSESVIKKACSEEPFLVEVTKPNSVITSSINLTEEESCSEQKFTEDRKKCCIQCSLEFESLNSLKDHIMTKHIKRVKCAKCHQCGRLFADESVFQNHLQDAHGSSDDSNVAYVVRHVVDSKTSEMMRHLQKEHCLKLDGIATIKDDLLKAKLIGKECTQNENVEEVISIQSSPCSLQGKETSHSNAEQDVHSDSSTDQTFCKVMATEDDARNYSPTRQIDLEVTSTNNSTGNHDSPDDPLRRNHFWSLVGYFCPNCAYHTWQFCILTVHLENVHGYTKKEVFSLRERLRQLDKNGDIHKMFNRVPSLKSLKWKQTESDFQCSKCKKSFRLKSGLMSHRKICMTPDPRKKRRRTSGSSHTKNISAVKCASHVMICSANGIDVKQTDRSNPPEPDKELEEQLSCTAIKSDSVPFESDSGSPLDMGNSTGNGTHVVQILDRNAQSTSVSKDICMVSLTKKMSKKVRPAFSSSNDKPGFWKAVQGYKPHRNLCTSEKNKKNIIPIKQKSASHDDNRSSVPHVMKNEGLVREKSSDGKFLSTQQIKVSSSADSTVSLKKSTVAINQHVTKKRKKARTVYSMKTDKWGYCKRCNKGVYKSRSHKKACSLQESASIAEQYSSEVTLKSDISSHGDTEAEVPAKSDTKTDKIYRSRSRGVVGVHSRFQFRSLNEEHSSENIPQAHMTSTKSYTVLKCLECSAEVLDLLSMTRHLQNDHGWSQQKILANTSKVSQSISVKKLKLHPVP